MQIIVTTTIFEPSIALRKFACIPGWTLLVVGDKKTPHDSYRSMANIIYLDPDYQETHYKKLSDLIGWNCIQRRNIGYIDAYRRGATIIASIDDDNIPKDGWGEELFLEKEGTYRMFTPTNPSTPVWDPLSATSYKHLWHRGFPLDLIQQKNELTVSTVTRAHTIQADFWDGDPDVDAIERLVFAPTCTFQDSEFPFCGSVSSPFNSQNTFFTREAIKDYFLFPHVGRMDDIWGSYYAQAKGHKVLYNKATVIQERNVHNYLVDFSKEVDGYLNNAKLIAALRSSPEAICEFVPERSYQALLAYRSLFESFPLTKYTYDLEKYPFHRLGQSIFQFNQSLEAIHSIQKDNAQITFNNDTKTVFQDIFYKSPQYSEFRDLYYTFVKNEIFKIFPGETSLVVQKDPCFRVCPCENTALGLKETDTEDRIGIHCDADYNHPSSEYNFILAITELWDTNSVYIESEPEKEDFAPLKLARDQYAMFYGNKCRHYNKKNVSGQSRVSIDFRVIPFSKYDASYGKTSVHGQRKFIIGDYFIQMHRD